MERIPVSAPGRAAAALQDELSTLFARFVTAGRYIHGPEHAAFESEFASFLDVQNCVGVASGTDALELALLGSGCCAGDEVLVAANCGGYAALAGRRLGLQVRFADVDATTLSLSASTVEAALTRKVKAVVVTHLYGLIAEIEEIVDLCRGLGVVVIEDCAQAAGARRNGRRAGAFGDIAAFSFYPTKNLAALGDGGAIVTSNDDVADVIRRLRQYGWDTKYEITIAGGRNSRLDEIQAAVLRISLGQLDERNARRRWIVERYAAALSPDAGRFVSGGGEEYVAHLAVVISEDRERLRAALRAASVDTDVHYPIADHRQPLWSSEYDDIRLPVTEDAVAHVLTVPCFPELTDVEVGRVCEVLHGL
jgi:dTDP-4-amino-4,6-dideoxygalactose transaminase